MEIGIEKCTKLIVEKWKKEKQWKGYNGPIGKASEYMEKKKLQIPGNESRHHQTIMKEKVRKEYLRKKKKKKKNFSKPNTAKVIKN